MKFFFITFCLTALLSINVSAQLQNVQRAGYSRALGGDSVDVSFRQDYFLVEDSCADIIRLCRFDRQERRFIGSFKDVSKLNPEHVVATGTYDEKGLKEGTFTSYYLNGKIQARGKFKNNLFHDKWEFFYPTGEPKIVFVANGSEVKIVNAWNEEGKKTIDNGHGDYESVLGAIVWKGELVGGTPDGKWTAIRMFHPEEVLVTERFKLGEFQKGRNKGGEYTDSSRIVLVSPDLLPLVKAENLWVSSDPCKAVPQKLMVNARYGKGAEQFGEEIGNRLGPVLSRMNISFNEPIELQGKILENGRIIFDAQKGDSKLTTALISELHSLPSLEPARADGRPAQQDMIITIRLNSSVYIFSYRLLPIKVD